MGQSVGGAGPSEAVLPSVAGTPVASPRAASPPSDDDAQAVARMAKSIGSSRERTSQSTAIPEPPDKIERNRGRTRAGIVRARPKPGEPAMARTWPSDLDSAGQPLSATIARFPPPGGSSGAPCAGHGWLGAENGVNQASFPRKRQAPVATAVREPDRSVATTRKP
jgi:hypothetical protein